jgi:hypothetical protein
MIDIDKYKKKKLTVRRDKEGNKDDMSYYEFSRWLSLLEAIQVVDKKCKQMKLPDADKSWIKPIALQKYVDERTESMLFEITNEGRL